MNGREDEFEANQDRYNTDPVFSHQIDIQTELSTVRFSAADCPVDMDIHLLMQVAHEYWLHGEVHLFPDGGTVRFLPPSRILETPGGPTRLLLTAREHRLAAKVQTTREFEARDDGNFALILRDNEYTVVRRTGPGVDYAAEFVADMRKARKS